MVGIVGSVGIGGSSPGKLIYDHTLYVGVLYGVSYETLL